MFAREPPPPSLSKPLVEIRRFGTRMTCCDEAVIIVCARWGPGMSRTIRPGGIGRGQAGMGCLPGCFFPMLRKSLHEY